MYKPDYVIFLIFNLAPPFYQKDHVHFGDFVFHPFLSVNLLFLPAGMSIFFFLFFRNLMYFSRLVQMSSVETLPHVTPQRAKSMAPPSYSYSTLYTPLSHSVYHLVNTKGQVLLIFCDSCLAHSELAILLS